MIRPLYFHNPNQEGFEAIIKHLHSKNYKFISIEELYSRLEKNDTKGKLAYISFDDGWQGNLKLIPIIEKYNVHITIFIAGNSLQKKLVIHKCKILKIFPTMSLKVNLKK